MKKIREKKHFFKKIRALREKGKTSHATIARRLGMEKTIVGIRESHNVINARDLGI